MKNGAGRHFWSLRPNLTIRPAELAVLLIALMIFLALLGSVANRPVGAAAAVSVSPASTVVAISDTHARRCIRRIMDLNHGLTEEALASRINDECFSPIRRTTTPSAPPVLACLRAAGIRVPVPSGDEVTGCLLD